MDFLSVDKGRVDVLKKEIYDFIQNQYLLAFNRSQSIETKALNVTIFAGVILGLEFNMINYFYNNLIVGNQDFLYYLVAISTSFFVSAILLGVATIIESHNCFIFKPIFSSEFESQYSFYDKVLDETKDWLEIHENKVESKNRYLSFSLYCFLVGILVTVLLFGYIIRYTLYS